MSKEKRKRELEKEIEKLQRKLGSLDDGRQNNNDDDFDEERKIRRRNRHEHLPPKPALPPRPVTSRKVGKAGKVVKVSTISTKEREQLRKEAEQLKQEKHRLKEEAHRMKDALNTKKREFSDFRRELRERENEIREKERDLRNKRVQSHSYSWDTDINEDMEVLTDDLEFQLGDYTRSILASVAESLKSSMGIVVKGTGDVGIGMKHVGDELDKIGLEIGDKIAKDVYVSVGATIPEDKLEEFYEIGATIVAAVGDSNRLKILKELERGPKYQKELSDITNLRGGTFKHHMDRLLDREVKFVTQEVVRGRYLLTTRGREALKLAEMQYRRYLQEKKREEKKGALNKDKLDLDDEFDVVIK